MGEMEMEKEDRGTRGEREGKRERERIKFRRA